MTQEPNAGKGNPAPVGSGERTVLIGECVISIANEVGHLWETVWNDSANEELKTARGAPHVLLEGDRLHVPPIQPKDVAAATDKTHRFERKGIPIHFELVVKEDDEPLAGCRYTLNIEGKILEGTIPDDGLIRVPIKAKTCRGELRTFVDSIERVYPLVFGSLDPPHTSTGAVGRLQNMDYLESDDEKEIQDALKKFQRDHSLSDSGELDEATAAKLAEVHGS